MLYYVPGVVIVLCGLVYALYKHKLSIAGAITGSAIALLLLFSLGYAALHLMTAFFMLGTLATWWMTGSKKSLWLSEENNGQRTAGQVLANAGVGAVLALVSLLYIDRQGLYLLMLAAAFSSATADTLSSELGNVYGKRFFNVVSFKKDTKGLNGVVSLEGTLAGLAGSAIIACIYAGFVHSMSHVAIIILAGTAGNLFDSFLGATLENKQVIGNNVVNFLNTLFAALIAWLLWVLIDK